MDCFYSLCCAFGFFVLFLNLLLLSKARRHNSHSDSHSIYASTAEQPPIISALQNIKVQQTNKSKRVVVVVAVIEMLAHNHYESMFSSTALVYRRSHMCRFECNVRVCADELLP